MSALLTEKGFAVLQTMVSGRAGAGAGGWQARADRVDGAAARHDGETRGGSGRAAVGADLAR